jgi:hypothetical protein
MPGRLCIDGIRGSGGKQGSRRSERAKQALAGGEKEVLPLSILVNRERNGSGNLGDRCRRGAEKRRGKGIGDGGAAMARLT